MRMPQRRLRTPDTRGFSLAELVVTVGILVLTLSGVMVAFIGAIALNRDSEMTSRALNEAMAQVEAVRMQAIANFNNVALGTTLFEMTGPVGNAGAYAALGQGVLTVTRPNPADLFYVIDAKVCWLGEGGRSMGEDRNLNGVLDVAAGEDINGDNELTCPVHLVTTVAQRN